MEEKVDFRVKKTRKALLQALRALLSEKSFDDITVTELCERAEIRRVTFYSHFGGKEELFSYMLREMQQNICRETEAVAKTQTPVGYCANVLGQILDFMEENEKIAETVMDSSAKNLVLDVLSQQIGTDLRSCFSLPARQNASLPANPEMLAVLCSGALLGCARWWVTQGKQLSKKELTAQFTALMERSMAGRLPG